MAGHGDRETTSGQPPPAAVVAQLEKILSSPPFLNAERLRKFLRFLVEQSLQGTPPKEYTLGVDVFDRDSSYDPRVDPVVRVEARRLRYKLREYYDTAGRSDKLEITLPKGGYGIEIRERSAGAPEQKSRIPNWKVLAITGVVVTGIATILITTMSGPERGWKASIAVLPLENLSNDESQEYFADGMTDALITDLARIKSLRVISRTSVLQFKKSRQPIGKIAGVLGVDYVVEGTVLPVGDRVRITAQLIATSNERHVWAETYERSQNDVLALQAEIAGVIADQIRLQLSPQDRARITQVRPVNPEVLQAYWKGRHQWHKRTPEGLKKSLDYFGEAVAKDPGYALAWAGLADAHNLMGSYRLVPMRESHPQARAAAERALQIDENLAEAHAALAAVIADYYWDWPLAEREFRRALEINPNYPTARQWFAEYLSRMGRHGEALTEIDKAVLLDPLSPLLRGIRAHTLYYSGRNDEAIAEIREVIETDPGAWPPRVLLGLALIRKGSYQQTVTEIQAGLKFAGDSPDLRAILGSAYALSGQRAEAQQILTSLLARADSPPFRLAQLSLSLGDKDQALSLLERACGEHDVSIGLLKVAPGFEGLRNEPRFAMLLKKLNLAR